jgi:8-oxo-dGTP pyrophosphatase MutT (NUDIX family)
MTARPDPDPEAEWWTTKDVAAYLGVEPGAVSSYRRRGQMPAPDQTIGSRTHLWKPSRIISWQESRPRAGVGGRPRGGPKPPVAGHETIATPLPDNDSRWIVHGRRPLYENEWIKLYKTDVELPDGQRFEHHTVWMPTAAMAAVLNDDLTHVLLMWRHRFVPDLWNWELPGGLVDGGEEPAQTAAREIEEETGYRPRTLEHLVTFEPMIGMVTTPHHVFIARGAERVGEPTEKTEMQRMEWVPLAQVPNLIAQGQVSNSGTLVALLHVLAISGPTAPRRSQEAG